MTLAQSKHAAAKLHRQIAATKCKIIADETNDSEALVVSFLNFTDLVKSQKRCVFRSERFSTAANKTTSSGVECPCENFSQVVFSADGRKQLCHSVKKVTTSTLE